MLGVVLPSISSLRPAQSLRGSLGSLGALTCALFLLAAIPGCDPGPQGATPVGNRAQGVCVPANGGGDIGCPCTDNTQCFNYDEDARTLVCDAPAGMTVGVCKDCLTAANRPVGCACNADAECAAGTKCNGRTCQVLRARGEICFFDADCGTDMIGAMSCLPTKGWCGPLADGNFCDFDTDCINGNCNDFGTCSSGAIGDDCLSDANCKAGFVCSLVTYKCIDKQADGAPCTRNAECINQCNSFTGRCLLGEEGQPCTTMNPDGDCMAGQQCTDCMTGFTCRPMGSNCP